MISKVPFLCLYFENPFLLVTSRRPDWSLPLFLLLRFFHSCDKNHKMTPIWKQKKIADGPEYFLFSNSHGPSHFLACISSKRTLCTTLFSSKVCEFYFPYVDLFHFWNLRIFVLFCGKVVRTFKQNNSFQNIWMLLFACHIENFFFVLHESILFCVSAVADFA